MCAIIALLLVSVALQKPAAAVQRCSITIVLPHHWTAGRSSTSRDGTCEFGVIPREAWSRIRRDIADVKIDPYPIHISVIAGTVETALKAQGLSKDERGWYFEGRAGVTNRATQLTTSCCTAIRGASEVGNYGDRGYVGMGEAQIGVVIGNGRIVWMQGDPMLSLLDDGTEAFDKLMMSVKFR